MSRKEQFIIERNWQSQQLSILVSMLNLVGDIILEKPIKSKTRSLAFFKVISVTINNKHLNVRSLTEKRVEELCQKDKQNEVNETKMKRRKDVYEIMEHLHVLMDIVIKETRFELVTSNTKHNSLNDKRSLKSCIIDNVSLCKNEIKVFGNALHEAIMKDLMSDEMKSTCYFQKGNTQLMSIFVDESLFQKAEEIMKEKKLKKENAKKMISEKAYL